MSDSARGVAKKESIVLLHISDIHMKEKDFSSSQDLDSDVRAQMLEDLRGVIPKVGRVDGVLVTGDIAFAGKKEEYEFAYEWLNTLCDVVGCPHENVWTVPGNHDVDRSVIASSQILRNAHEVIRRKKPNTQLTNQLKDAVAAEYLLKPIQAYNKHLANHYETPSLPHAISWRSNLSLDEAELALNDGTRLRLVGLHSALVSGPNDDENEQGMVIGLKQAQISTEAGVVAVVLCHHPPNWWLDRKPILAHLKNRAAIQLYGHEHSREVGRLDSCIQVFAGALHPDRNEEGWQPCYNVLRLRVIETNEKRQLNVEVFPRVWKVNEAKFGPERDSLDRYPYEEQVDLAAWSPATEPAVAGDGPGPAGKHSDTLTQPESSSTDNDQMKAPRRMIYQLFALPYSERIRLIVELNLLEDDDHNATDAELVRRVIRRAREQERLIELKGGIERYTQELQERVIHGT